MEELASNLDHSCRLAPEFGFFRPLSAVVFGLPSFAVIFILSLIALTVTTHGAGGAKMVMMESFGIAVLAGALGGVYGFAKPLTFGKRPIWLVRRDQQGNVTPVMESRLADMVSFDDERSKQQLRDLVRAMADTPGAIDPKATALVNSSAMSYYSQEPMHDLKSLIKAGLTSMDKLQIGLLVVVVVILMVIVFLLIAIWQGDKSSESVLPPAAALLGEFRG